MYGDCNQKNAQILTALILNGRIYPGSQAASSYIGRSNNLFGTSIIQTSGNEKNILQLLNLSKQPISVCQITLTIVKIG